MTTIKERIKEIGGKVNKKELIENNGEYYITLNGKKVRVASLTLNKNDYRNEELIRWIYSQKDLSNSLKFAIQLCIEMYGTDDLNLIRELRKS